MPGLDAGRDQQGLAQRPVLDRLVQAGLETSGTSIVISLGPISRGAITWVRWNVLDRVDRQVDGRVERVAVEGQQRAEPEGDPFLELVGLGLEAEPGGALALHAAGVAAGLGRS